MNDQDAATPADLRVDAATMTLTEAAQHLNVHRITIYRLLKDKADTQLGQFKVGRVWPFRREAVARFGE
jgi:excisionase family DNA binding protein